MTDVVLWERQLSRNTGFAIDLNKGQSVRITSQTIIDFVCFNRKNLRERFDQARTKANQRKVFLTTGDSLVSKLKTQRGIKIDHKVIPAANHFFQDKTDELVEVCSTYLDRRMSSDS